MSAIRAAEPVDREPQELRGYTESTHPDRMETYWRYGYRVEQGKPQVVDEWARSEDHAQKLAEYAARNAQATLLKIAAPAKVEWWTQRWITRSTTEYDTERTGWVTQ